MKRRGNNEGSIYPVLIERNGTEYKYWEGQIHVGHKDSGKPNIKKIRRKTRKAVQEELEKIKRDIVDGRFVTGNKLLFNEWIANYLENYKQNRVRSTTYDTYIILANNHIYPAFQKMKLQDVRTHHIQKLISEKVKIRSTSLVTKPHAIINMALQQAVREERIRRNYAEDTELPSQKQKEKKPLSDTEVIKLRQSALGHRLNYSLLLLLTTGIRREELLGLQWQDVDFNNNTIRIERVVIPTKGIGTCGYKIDAPKTNSSRREIAVPHVVMKMLKGIADKRPKNATWIVPQEKEDKPLSPRNYSRTFKQWCIQAGVQTQGTHNLRHTYATTLAALQINPKVAQAQLGHANIKTTLNVYTHVVDEAQHHAAAVLNQKLFTGGFLNY